MWRPQEGQTTFVVDLGFGVVVVRHVPALACVQCGETWLEDEVAGRLEEVVDDARSRQLVVEVADWAEGGAAA